MTSAHSSFVIGNGPSLRGFDLRRLSRFTTIGMNAAYRHWDRIGWYPTHYCCLDDELIATHHAEIHRLVSLGLVKSAFLTAAFLEHHADAASDNRFVFLDSFVGYWHRTRGAKVGLPRIDSEYFRISDPDKVTTGSHATRYAAHLGASRIYLMGIDLKYVELLPEAKQTGDISLEMTTTPATNPNYFFDDYQRKGDRFNIPNPEAHGRNLHFASFEVLAKDFRELSRLVRISNTNRASRLFEEAVFPYRRVEDVIGERSLGAVAIPAVPSELGRALDQLWLFEQDAFRPFVGPTPYAKPDLVYVFNNEACEPIEAAVRSYFGQSKTLPEDFAGIEFKYLDIRGEADIYHREYTAEIGPLGYKAGPNNQFFAAMSALSEFGRYAFYMETDCVPIRPNWLGRLSDILAHGEPLWVMGSLYRGVNTLQVLFKRHINGNAVYAVGDQGFQEFLIDFWLPRLQEIVREDPRIAYDCALEIVFERANSSGGNGGPDDDWRMLQEVYHRFRYSEFVQNRSGKRDATETPENLIQTLYEQKPDTYLVHGQVFAEGAKALRASGLQPTVENLRLRPVEQAPAAPTSATEAAPSTAADSGPPRVLIFDMTRCGDMTATGEVKSNLFGDWPRQSLLQVYSRGGSKLGLWSDSSAGESSRAQIRQAIAAFSPDVVLYRPVPDVPELHALAMDVIRKIRKPVVTWIMDDWPERLRVGNPAAFPRMDADLRELFEKAADRFAISEDMAEAFGQRYGVSFKVHRNGAAKRDWENLTRYARSDGIRIRYAGSLAPETTRDSVFEVARAVEDVAQHHRVSLEIKTHVTWLAAERERYAKFEHVTLGDADLDPKKYRSWLAEADLLLLAYNFDPETAAYLRFSFANKLPEYLASGAPVLAYGPLDIGTMRFLKDRNAALIVAERDGDKLRAGIERLITQGDLRTELAKAANAVAFADLDLDAQRVRFQADLTAAALEPAARDWRPPDVANFPLSREDAAQLDECQLVFEVLREIPAGIMLDVGAHIGGSLKPFAEAGWTVHAFEPDPKNRARLTESFGASKNVIISGEAVSGTAGEEVPFYASEESTGISGLSAFRDTHREVARVKTVTLDEIVARSGVSRIDFLKIDIEGWELPVLRAFDFGRVTPGAVLVEYENDKTEAHGYDAHDLAQFLVDRGYTVYVSEWHPIERYGVKHSFRRVQKYPCEIPANSWGNLIGFRTDPAPALLKQAIRAAVDRPVLFEGEVEPADAVRTPAPAAASGATRKEAKSAPLSPLSARFGGRKGEAAAPAPSAPSAPPAEPAMGARSEPAKAMPPPLPRRRRWRRPNLAELLRPARRRPVLSITFAVAVLAPAILLAAWPFVRLAARPEILFALLLANVVLAVLFARLQRKTLISRLSDLFRRMDDARNDADQTTRGSLRRRLDEIQDATLRELREQSKAAVEFRETLLKELREQSKTTADLRHELTETKQQLSEMQAPTPSARQQPPSPAASAEPPRSGGRRRRRRPPGKG